MTWPATPTHGKLARILHGTTNTAVGTTAIDYSSRWSINWVKDAAVFGRQGVEYKEAAPGQANWTGTAEFIFIRSSEQASLCNIAVSTEGTVALTTALTTAYKFSLDATNRYLYPIGGFIITGVTFDAPVGDVVRCNYSFQGSGGLKFVETTFGAS